MEDLKNIIRDIPDFPKKGIIFKDITTLLQDAKSYQRMVDLLAHRYIGQQIDKVVGVEARGFIIGSALAYKLGAGVVLVRKPGKLPSETFSKTYDLEYGTDTLEIHKDAIKPGETDPDRRRPAGHRRHHGGRGRHGQPAWEARSSSAASWPNWTSWMAASGCRRERFSPCCSFDTNEFNPSKSDVYTMAISDDHQAIEEKARGDVHMYGEDADDE